MKAMHALAASERAQEGIDPEMLGTILLAATLVWSLRARSGPEGETGTKKATQRFTRELKRLLLFGALKLEVWPDLLAASKASGDAHDEEKRSPNLTVKDTRRSARR